MNQTAAHDGPAPEPIRRHDLDSLRAVAMLMGIVLHGAIAFVPGVNGWAVQDTQTHEAYGVLLSLIHGFRMPLFFLLSGFFTMMLLRKRGTWALLVHRFKRIFLPLIISLVTIIPLTWGVSEYVTKQIAALSQGAAVESRDMFNAAAHGDVQRIQTLVDAGEDVNQRAPDGTTPFLLAAFLGRAESAQLLIDLGADPTIAKHDGTSPLAAMQAPWETTKGIADWLKVDVVQEEVDRGREVVFEMLGADVEQLSAAASKAPGRLEGLIAFLIGFPILGHLWFLWFLCWLVIGFVAIVAVVGWLRIPAVPTRFITTKASLLWLVPLTMIPQAFMGVTGVHFGPDTSLGVLPMPHVFAYYAIFFGFGAIFYDAVSSSTEPVLQTRWWLSLSIALLVFFPLGMASSGVSSGSARWLSVFSQATYVWLMSIGMMGMFTRFFSTRRPVMRYLSDASYWLYLAHIPLIIYIQFLVRGTSLPSPIKFLIVCVVTSVILLASYQVFVRHTPIGWLLNGKRKKLDAPASE